jgi:hypothetical protein
MPLQFMVPYYKFEILNCFSVELLLKSHTNSKMSFSKPLKSPSIVIKHLLKASYDLANILINDLRHACLGDFFSAFPHSL